MRNKKYVGKRKMIEILRKELGPYVKAKDCRYEKYHGSEWLKFHDWTGNEKCGFHNCDDNNYEIYSSGYGSYFSFRIYIPIYDEDGDVKTTTKSRRIYPVFEEEKSETLDDIKEIERNLH